MTWADTLGNMRALDAWRKSAGLEYEFEKPAKSRIKVDGRALSKPSQPMRRRKIAGIDREASVPGHPLIWAVSGERLYLFYNEKSRAAFLKNPVRIIESATRKWPEVARTVGR